MKVCRNSGSALLSVVILLGASLILGGIVTSYVTNIFTEIKELQTRTYRPFLEGYLNEVVDCNLSLPPGPCAGGEISALVRTDRSPIEIIYKNASVVLTCEAGNRLVKVTSDKGMLLAEYLCL